MATIFNAQGAKVTGKEMIQLTSERPKEVMIKKPIPDLDERMRIAAKYKGTDKQVTPAEFFKLNG